MIRRIGVVARREFLETVMGRGFLIGLLIVPAISLLGIIIVPRMLTSSAPEVRGTVAIIDRAGGVAVALHGALDRETLRAKREATAARAVRAVTPGVTVPGATAAAERALGTIPNLRVVDLSTDADVAAEKARLADPGAEGRLALLIVQPDAIAPVPGSSEYGSYELYVSKDLDSATETVIIEAMREAVVSTRLRANRLDPEAIDATMRVVRPPAVIVEAAGEVDADRRFNRMLPFVLSMLMFVGVMIGGQTLMTSTIEEKSSRIVEVLLAAVSPFELMAGKMLGQLGISLVTISVYLGFGLFALFSFSAMGLFDPILVAYLLIFFLITYLFFGAIMMAIGAAVNQAAEAQSFMAPVMVLLVAPFAFAPVIGRTPNSTLSTILSFVPPINASVMLSRLASETPPPLWQVGLSIAAGLAAACAVLWFAGKIFKIGLLMHGKPPDLRTLLRWARQA